LRVIFSNQRGTKILKTFSTMCTAAIEVSLRGCLVSEERLGNIGISSLRISRRVYKIMSHCRYGIFESQILPDLKASR
jgi:hypothetical protein